VLARVHDAVIAGGRPPVRPRGVVARSWSRVLDLGLDASCTNAREPLPFDEVERRRRSSPLVLVVDELRQVLVSVADASSFLMVVTDSDGVILWREGSARVRLRADALGFTEGARWTEATVGTNAIGTALTEAAPVQLFSAEHFEQAQHPWYCTAAPIHHPVSGELLGIADVSGPALTLHPGHRRPRRDRRQAGRGAAVAPSRAAAGALATVGPRRTCHCSRPAPAGRRPRLDDRFQGVVTFPRERL
jgi:transcriptional regulator of acetoin/glycerol metabolism